MTVLVTGGAGYVGSAVVWALYDKGEKVVVLDDLSTGDRALLPPEVKFYHMDMNKDYVIHELCEMYKVTDLIHMAAKTSVPESMALPLEYLRADFWDAGAVMQAANTAGVDRVVFSSTAAVYGERKQMTRTSEDEVPNPANPYGRAKLMTEWHLDAMSRQFRDFKFAALRYFNVAGADPKLRQGQIAGEGLFRQAIKAALDDTPFVVYGERHPTMDGTAVRDFVHVTDVANAHIDALKAMRTIPHYKRGTFNVGYGEGYSVFEVLMAIQKATGKKINKVSHPNRAGDVPYMVSDAQQIRMALGWRPQHHLLETMATTAVAWEQEWRRKNGKS